MVVYDTEWDCRYRDPGNNMVLESNNLGSSVLYWHLWCLNGILTIHLLSCFHSQLFLTLETILGISPHYRNIKRLILGCYTHDILFNHLDSRDRVDHILFQVTSNSWALLGATTIISSLFLVTIVGQGGKSSDTTTYSRIGSSDVEFPEMVRLDEHGSL